MTEREGNGREWNRKEGNIREWRKGGREEGREFKMADRWKQERWDREGRRDK